MDPRLVDGIGLWLECLTNVPPISRPALFLDRDGVIAEEVHYLCRASDVRMIVGAAATIRRVNDLGVPVVIVTNQAGIGRGYYDWAAFQAVQTAIIGALAREGARIDLVLACAYHQDAVGEFRQADHTWRKPNPGMMLAAAQVLGTDLSSSLIVGDRISDLEAGRRAGIGYGILVQSGYGRTEIAGLSRQGLEPLRVSIAADIGDAVSQAQAMGWLAARD